MSCDVCNVLRIVTICNIVGFWFFSSAVLTNLRPWLEADQFPFLSSQLSPHIQTLHLFESSHSGLLYAHHSYTRARYQTTRGSLHALEPPEVIQINQS